MIEAYAWHFFPQSPMGGCATGPVLPGAYRDPKAEGRRTLLKKCTYDIWNEDAYQLYMDVETLSQLLEQVDPESLRADRAAEALENFTLAVDFEQPLTAHVRDYQKAREILKPATVAHNGSAAPVMYAVGNAHLGLARL